MAHPVGRDVPTWLEACGKAIGAESCDQAATKAPAECTIPPGTLADGQQCLSDDQCKGGVCNTPIPSGPAPGEDGGTFDGGSSPCGTCGEKQSSGACEEDSDCPGSEVCTYATSATGTLVQSCVTPGAAGATCSASAPCEGTLACPLSGASASAVCTALPTLGQPCLSAYVSGAGECANGLVCGTNNTCATPTYVTPGGSCSLATEVCAAGTCIAGKCVALGGEGSACDLGNDPQCGPTLECKGGTCVAVITVNQMCEN